MTIVIEDITPIRAMGTVRCEIGSTRVHRIRSVSHQHIEPARAGTVWRQFRGQLADVKVTGRVPVHILPRDRMRRGNIPSNRYRLATGSGSVTGTDEYTGVRHIMLLNEVPLVDGDTSYIAVTAPPCTDLGIPPICRSIHVSPRSCRKPAIEIVRIRQHSQADLMQVANANGAPSLFPRLVERGQEHRGENADDGDDDKEFDQGEGSSSCRCFTTGKP